MIYLIMQNNGETYGDLDKWPLCYFTNEEDVAKWKVTNAINVARSATRRDLYNQLMSEFNFTLAENPPKPVPPSKTGMTKEQNKIHYDALQKWRAECKRITDEYYALRQDWEKKVNEELGPEIACANYYEVVEVPVGTY